MTRNEVLLYIVVPTPLLIYFGGWRIALFVPVFGIVVGLLARLLFRIRDWYNKDVDE